ncbi:MAG: metal-sensing transcriptional repressor [Oscillospiraceae bacterium]|nr:metal-sensing transcriptional repressor [Oscillospiraceae bacterium]
MMADKDKVSRLVKTARGQLDGVLRMIEEDRYCMEVSAQLRAAQALLAKADREILKAHIAHCVRDAFDSRDEAEIDRKIEELVQAMEKIG